MSKHTPGPWRWSDKYKTSESSDTWSLIGADGFGILSCDGTANSPQEVNKADAPLIAAAPELLEAAVLSFECGIPEKVSLCDEEGVDGWRWAHPDGREWTEIGSWDDVPPMHPVMESAVKKARGES